MSIAQIEATLNLLSGNNPEVEAKLSALREADCTPAFVIGYQDAGYGLGFTPEVLYATLAQQSSYCAGYLACSPDNLYAQGWMADYEPSYAAFLAAAEMDAAQDSADAADYPACNMLF